MKSDKTTDTEKTAVDVSSVLVAAGLSVSQRSSLAVLDPNAASPPVPRGLRDRGRWLQCRADDRAEVVDKGDLVVLPGREHHVSPAVDGEPPHVLQPGFLPGTVRFAKFPRIEVWPVA